MTKFNVGDKVKIRKGLVVGKRYGTDTFVGHMEKHCGRNAVITEITPSGKYKITSEAGTCTYNFTDEMIEGYAKLTKKDLNSNMILETRDKDRHLYLEKPGLLVDIRSGLTWDIDDYNDDLTKDNGYRDMDVCRIYAIHREDSSVDYLSDCDLKLIWERTEVVKMSKNQVLQKLREIKESDAMIREHNYEGFDKSKLKTGYILEYIGVPHWRKDRPDIVLLGTTQGDIAAGSEWYPLESYDNDYLFGEEGKVQRVLSPRNNRAFTPHSYLEEGSLDNASDYSVIWERKKHVYDLSDAIKIVEEAIGKKIEITDLD